MLPFSAGTTLKMKSSCTTATGPRACIEQAQRERRRGHARSSARAESQTAGTRSGVPPTLGPGQSRASRDPGGTLRTANGARRRGRERVARAPSPRPQTIASGHAAHEIRWQQRFAGAQHGSLVAACAVDAGRYRTFHAVHADRQLHRWCSRMPRCGSRSGGRKECSREKQPHWGVLWRAPATIATLESPQPASIPVHELDCAAIPPPATGDGAPAMNGRDHRHAGCAAAPAAALALALAHCQVRVVQPASR